MALRMVQRPSSSWPVQEDAYFASAAGPGEQAEGQARWDRTGIVHRTTLLRDTA